MAWFFYQIQLKAHFVGNLIDGFVGIKNPCPRNNNIFVLDVFLDGFFGFLLTANLNIPMQKQQQPTATAQ